MEDFLYNELNKAWKTTCKVLFKEEIGELKEYEEWLKDEIGYKRYVKRVETDEREGTITPSYYKGRFVRFEKAKTMLNTPALNINEIKDIDSIREAISEKWFYVTNRVMGKSEYVRGSDLIIDSYFVLDSFNIQNCKYIAYSSLMRKGSLYIFGSNGGGGNEFLVRVNGIYDTRRGFESYAVLDSSDAYYSAYSFGCQEIMFSFNQRGKRFVIGNIELSREKYYALKQKLLKEIVEELKKNKRLPSLFELIEKSEKAQVENIGNIEVSKKEEEEDFEEIEKGFKQTTRIILKKEYSIKELETYLEKRLSKIKTIESPFGNKVSYADEYFFERIPKDRKITKEEAEEAGKLKLNEKEINSFEQIKNHIGKIALIAPELVVRKNLNYIKTPVAVDAINSYRVLDATEAKHVGLSTYALNSEYCYGNYRILESSFCIKCHNSSNIRRGFELDSCSNCSDIYFSHFSEGLNNAMFCFNAKMLNNAVGNLKVGSRYNEIKEKLIEEINQKLEEDKDIGFDIYDLFTR